MRTIKLVIIGDSGVGKTSLRNQYIMGRFSTGYRATIGTDFITKTLPHYQNADESVTLQIWDTAGQERFSSLSTAFFRGADAALLMFDVNRPETLTALTKWWDAFKASAPVPDEEAEDFCCVVVGNKIDLAEDEDRQAGPSGIGIANGNREGRQRVSEAEAERFLEELIPRMPVPEDDAFEYGYDDCDHADPFVERGAGDQSRRTTGAFMRRSISGFSLHSVKHPPEADDEAESNPQAPTQTQSISIQPNTLSPSNHPSRKRTQKSRSSERSLYGAGTLNSMRTSQTMYHTPSSSLFDAFESAPTSPLHSLHSLPSSESDSDSTHGSPNVPGMRAPRRMASASSTSSAPTITPSLFLRTHAPSSASPTPPTPISSPSSAYPSPSAPRGPPRPERRPRLFLASAKTGVGVAPVFEHVARRVAMGWTYAEACESRETRRTRLDAGETLRLGLDRSRSETSLRERMLAKGGACCGS